RAPPRGPPPPLLLTTATPSSAQLSARGQRTVSTTSASWAADARLAPGGSPTVGSLLITGISTKNVLYFTFENYGTVDITGLTVSVSVRKGGGNNNAIVTGTFRVCSTSWDETADTCTGGGTITSLFSVTGSAATPPVTQTFTFPIPTPLTASGGNARIQVFSDSPGTQATIYWVSVSSNAPRQIRAATTTAS
ncbi:MAG: hypothetical protein ACKOI0_00630, partial [Actinomycetota bacterium]